MFSGETLRVGVEGEGEKGWSRFSHGQARLFHCPSFIVSSHPWKFDDISIRDKKVISQSEIEGIQI